MKYLTTIPRDLSRHYTDKKADKLCGRGFMPLITLLEDAKLYKE